MSRSTFRSTIALKSAYDDIDESTRILGVMHGENPNADHKVLTAGELHGFVGKTLEVCVALTIKVIG
jgi:hypothetical protein